MTFSQTSTDPTCKARVGHGVRAYVVRRGFAHVAATLTLDFADATRRVLFGLVCIQDRLQSRLSTHDLARAQIYIVETAQACLPGKPIEKGESVLSVASVSGDPVQLRCGGFRTRLVEWQVVSLTAL